MDIGETNNSKGECRSAFRNLSDDSYEVGDAAALRLVVH